MRWIDGIMRCTCSLICMIVLVAQSSARAQSEAQPELHWAGTLGQRSFDATRWVPIVDQVVLVPDEATYLDEIGKWSLEGRWPVLIEDERWTPMFVRRFGPAKVYRRSSTGAVAGTATDRLAAARRVVRHAWGGTAEDESIIDVLARLGARPTGIVLTSMTDPAWTAAVALAAGRGQVLDVLGGAHQGPNAQLSVEEGERLRASVRAALVRSGLAFDALGDDVDAITICRNMAGTAISNDPSATPPGRARTALVATTDLVGRDHAGRRFACTGWIFGSEVRSAYVAMSALFLPIERAWLFDTYGGKPAPYALEAARETLSNAGVEVQGVMTSATATAWRQIATRPLPADMIFVNTRGNVDFFETTAGRANTGDVLIPRGPAIVHFIHSWSMARADDASTIGGRWLDHGAYAMVGSVQEPFLGAFVPGGEVARRCMAGVPFLVAARWFAGQSTGDHPWRVQTYGDPLMLARPLPMPPRLIPRSPADGVDLEETARTQMEACEADPSDEVFGAAVASLVLMRRYELAIQLWETAVARELGMRASRSILPALFEIGTDEQFVQAWMELGARDPLAIDMLWLRLKPGLGARTTDDELLLLQSVVRPGLAINDLKALRPWLRSRFGEEHFARLVQRVIDETNHAGRRRSLETLLKTGG